MFESHSLLSMEPIHLCVLLFQWFALWTLTQNQTNNSPCPRHMLFTTPCPFIGHFLCWEYSFIFSLTNFDSYLKVHSVPMFSRWGIHFYANRMSCPFQSLSMVLTQTFPTVLMTPCSIYYLLRSLAPSLDSLFLEDATLTPFTCVFPTLRKVASP